MTDTFTVTVDFILSLLNGVKSTGDKKWQALCPAHNDTAPSLSVSVGDDGKILLNCHAGCTFEDICAALGVERQELFPKKTSARSARTDRPKAIFEYQDAEGNTVGRKRKYAEGSDWQRPDGSGKWLTGLDGRKMPLFNLPALVQADPDELVFFPEGEKDVLTLKDRGLVAVTNPNGCSENWLPMWNEYLRNRKVVILPDNDKPGIKHARKVAAGLLDEAEEVKIVLLDDLPDKGDVSDWMQTGGDVPQLMLRVEKTKPQSESDFLSEKVTKGDFNFTEAGNAERFASQHDKKMRFCCPWNQWLFFDGKRWNTQVGKQKATQLAIQTTRKISREAEDVSFANRQKILDFSLKSESASHLKAMLELAKSQLAIACYPETFDQDPMLFNMGNWTQNFAGTQFKIQKHNPADMITKVAAVRYDPDAQCPLWLECLDTWMAGDDDKIEYLQRLAGYCLTGDISARVFPIFYGPGFNGKSVFCNTIMGLMGDYATIAPRSLLSVRRFEEHPTELASLFGMRLVVAKETRQNIKLRVDLVKEMTGETMLKARKMRQNYFDFYITHKTILMTNHLPVINDTSDSIWDRVHLIDWPVRIPDDKIDGHLTDTLKKEWPGILNWLIAGCEKWVRANFNLNPPECVKVATLEYREESDPLKQFIEDCCVFDYDDKKFETSVRSLRSAYDQWAEENKIKFTISPRRFNDYFRQKGFEPKGAWQGGNVKKSVKCWKGIGLQKNEDTALPF